MFNNNSTTAFSTNTTSGAVGLIATVPLYTADLLQSRIREARANESRAEQDLEAARRNAAQMARQAYTGTDYGLHQVRALESAETSAKTQLESTRLGYQVGVRINLDVLNANTQLFNTQRDLKKARTRRKKKPSRARSRAVKKALKREPRSAASHRALTRLLQIECCRPGREPCASDRSGSNGAGRHRARRKLRRCSLFL